LFAQLFLCAFIFVARIGADLGLWVDPVSREASAWWHPLVFYLILGTGLAASIGIMQKRAWGYFLEAPLVAIVLYVSWLSITKNDNIKDSNLLWFEPVFRWVLAIIFIQMVWEIVAKGRALMKRPVPVSLTDVPVTPEDLNRRTLEKAIETRESN
jgi:cobalamin biosynthesis protein CobD/CbiB